MTNKEAIDQLVEEFLIDEVIDNRNNTCIRLYERPLALIIGD